MQKIRVGILFGGKSAEHEVSLQSAKNVYEALNKDKYEILLIGIDKDGRWYLYEDSSFLNNPLEPRQISLNNLKRTNLSINPWSSDKNLVLKDRFLGLDVVFPVLHGTYGEDGTIQGLLKLAQLPFVGASVLGSAIGMDKDVSKRLLQHADINIARFLVFKKIEKEKIDFYYIKEKLGLPFFVKPSNLGSSIGISKVKTKEDFKRAIDSAFDFDNKIIIEEFIKGRELECAVLGDQDDPIASSVGEIIPHHEFYSYDAKYIDEKGATLHIPANINSNLQKKIQEISIEAFKLLCCDGMARVDFFVNEKDEIYLNEINTIPGFTKISMYPKLWDYSGLKYSDLIDRLITLAIDRYKKESFLKTTVTE